MCNISVFNNFTLINEKNDVHNDALERGEIQLFGVRLRFYRNKIVTLRSNTICEWIDCLTDTIIGVKHLY
jgi:hypothetical protein